MMNNPDATLSIVVYRPKPGKEQDLLQLSREHVPYLRSEGLVAERPHIVAKAQDASIVEVFEWAPGGLARAHEHQGVQRMWTRYAEACDYVPLNSLAESAQMFANFIPLNA